jgi:hypothetical protein
MTDDKSPLRSFDGALSDIGCLRQLPFCKNVLSARSKEQEANIVARRQVQIIIAVGVAACVVGLVLWGKGRRDIVLDGTLQWGFEESAFFPNGDCSNKPLWWEWPNNRDSDLDAKWKALGKPTALRVKLRGNLSSIGLHGHLGAYHREVQPITLLSVSAASRCQWTWVKETP